MFIEEIYCQSERWYGLILFLTTNERRHYFNTMCIELQCIYNIYRYLIIWSAGIRCLDRYNIII